MTKTTNVINKTSGLDKSSFIKTEAEKQLLKKLKSEWKRQQQKKGQ